MRINNLKIAALMAATVLAGCRTAGDIDEIVAPHGFEFSATTEQDSKTALDGTKILWMAGDEISIFQGSAKGSKFVLAKGENTPNGTFSIAAGETFDFFGSTDPDATDPDYIALYPYDTAATIDGETVIATLPAAQTYAENSFGNGAYPMIARSASRALAFKNVCGGIELPLKDDNGKIVVKSVKISGNNGEKIAGEARIETGDVPTVIVAETGSESVTLDCGEGVALDAAAKSFILALPPTEFANGITIEVATANGVFTKTTANAVSIVRSGIRKMAELQVEEQTEEAGPVICNGESYETIADAVAANTDATEITLKAGTFTLPNDLKNLTINGREGTEINIENANPSRYSDVVFNNITFNAGQENYHGFQHAGNITFNKCTINGLLFGYGSHEIYNECVFNNPNGYSMWTYGANADYTGCVFNGNGKFLHVYNEGNVDLRTINIKDCKFVSTAKNKAAVSVKSSCNDTTHLQFNVNIDNCTTEGEFPEANGGLWACDNKFFDTVSIKVDGTEVYKKAGPVICNGESYETIADAVAANTDATEITLKAGTFTLPGDLKNLNFIGNEGSVIDIQNVDVYRYSDVVFNNITFNAGQENYHGFKHAETITFNKCTINGLLFGYGSHEIYNECVFNNPNGYSMWTYGANADYTGCVFNGNGKFLHVYNEGSVDLRTINIKNCKFVSTAKNKAAVSVKSVCNNTIHLQFNVNIDNCTTEGEFPEANGGLWSCDDKFFDSVSIKVDGTEVYKKDPGYKEVDGGYEVYSAQGMQWLAEQVNGGNNFSGKTVTLTANIDLDGIEWTPIGTEGKPFCGNFDGNGKTISNLQIDKGSMNDVGLFGYAKVIEAKNNAEIHNFTINNASVKGYLNVAIVCGRPYASVKLYDINITGHVELDGYAYVGTIAGYGYTEIDNCKVQADDSSYVKATNIYAGGICGFRGEGNGNTTYSISNCNSNIDVTGFSYVGGITGICHYGNTIDNCHVTANITETVSDGADESDKNGIGGIAGITVSDASLKCTIKGCSFTGSLTTNYEINHDGIVGGDKDGNVQQSNLVLENNTSNVTNK